MNLQNGYKVIYEVTAEGKRAFYATKNGVCDLTVNDKIVEATIGEYKLIYEKDGQIYGSTTGIPAKGDHCFSEFDRVFKVASEEPATAIEETTTPAIEETTAEPEVQETVEPTIEE